MEKTLVTAEYLPTLPEGERAELVEGEIIAMSPTSGPHGALATKFALHLANHVLPKDLGMLFMADTGFLLRRRPDTLRVPDVAFVSTERLRNRQRSGSAFLEVVPELIAEVVSPSDKAEDVQQRARMWLQEGSRLVVVAYPETEVVVVHADLHQARHYGRGSTITLGPIFPDFALPVDELFRGQELLK